MATVEVGSFDWEYNSCLDFCLIDVSLYGVDPFLDDY